MDAERVAGGAGKVEFSGEKLEVSNSGTDDTRDKTRMTKGSRYDLPEKTTAVQADTAPAGQAGRSGGDAVAAGLRQLWTQMENEPVPEDFLDILDRIDSARGTDAAS